MEWIRTDTKDYADPKIRLLKTKYKAEGYGIYIAIRNAIGELITSDNYEQWGYLPEDVENDQDLMLELTAASSVEVMNEVIDFCVNKNLLYRNKENNRLMQPKVLRRADKYTVRVMKEKKIDIEQRVQYLITMCTEGVHQVDTQGTSFQQINTEIKKEINNDRGEPPVSPPTPEEPAIVSAPPAPKPIIKTQNKTVAEWRKSMKAHADIMNLGLSDLSESVLATFEGLYLRILDGDDKSLKSKLQARIMALTELPTFKSMSPDDKATQIISYFDT